MVLCLGFNKFKHETRHFLGNELQPEKYNQHPLPSRFHTTPTLLRFAIQRTNPIFQLRPISQTQPHSISHPTILTLFPRHIIQYSLTSQQRIRAFEELNQ